MLVQREQKSVCGRPAGYKWVSERFVRAGLHLLQRFHAPALPEKAMAPARAEIGDDKIGKFAEALDLLPQLCLGPGIEYIEGELAFCRASPPAISAR